MAKYVGFKIGKVHESHVISEYYCGGCGWPVTDHGSFCPECGGAFRECDASDLGSENAKLREERDHLLMNSNPTATELRRVRSAWKKDRDENDRLKSENAKMRELFYEAWDWMGRARYDRSIRDDEMDEIGVKAIKLGFPDYELGVEVDR